jgi:hypothetical protein
MRIIIYVATAFLILASCGEQASVEPFPERRKLVLLDSIETGDPTDSIPSLSSVYTACHAPDGDVLILDQVSCCVFRYTPEGRLEQRMGRHGSGPGEMQSPLGMAVLGDGRIVVFDPFVGGVVVFGPQGEFRRNVTVWGQDAPLPSGPVGDSCFSAISIRVAPEDDELMVKRTIGTFSLQSAEPELVYYADQVPFNIADFSEAMRSMLFAFVHTAATDGRCFIAPRSSEDYVVTAFDSDGSELYRIAQNVPREPKSETEMEDERQYVETWAERIGVQGVRIDWQPDRYRDMITGLGVDGESRLWVQRGTELSPVFDVYRSESGEHIFSAALDRPSRSWRFTVDEHGILAWEEDPASGQQKVYTVGL